MSEELHSDELAGYLVRLGGALLNYGVPTHRLESQLTQIALKEGFEAHVFSVPTGVFLSVARVGGGVPVMRMVRVGEWTQNLDRLAAADRIANDFAARRLSIRDAHVHLDALEQRPGAWPPWAATVAAGTSTGAAAVFFNGNLTEVAVSAALGWVLGLLTLGLKARPALKLLENFFGGALIALCAALATAAWPALSREVLVLSGVIVLVPGVTLTLGMSELTHRNLVSGTARLMDALMTIVSLVLGLAVVVGLEQQLGFGVSPPVTHAGLGLAAQLCAVAVTGVGFSIRLGVPRGLLFGALGSCAVAWGTTLVLAPRLPGPASALLAALALTAFANTLARTLNLPSRVFSLPGLVLLVPGVFAFRSLDVLLRGDAAAGATQVATLLLTAGALVTGLAVGNVAVPSGRQL